MGHEHQYGPWLQSGPWASTWLQAAEQITDVHLDIDGNKGEGH